MLLPAPADDAELLARARSGDDSAVATLYEIHHAAALRLAHLLAGPDEAEDLLADVFARVVARFRAGAGPSSNFRGYLFTAIRNRNRDLRRRAGREEPVSHQPWLLDEAALPVDELPDVFDDEQAAAAFATLPDGWQRVLWLVEVEELCIGEIAARLDLTPAAVSSLAYRAREGLRTAYLEQRVGRVPATTSECAWVRERLGRYVRSGLSPRAAFRIASHLGPCVACARLRDDLERVNRRFRFCRRLVTPGPETTSGGEIPAPGRVGSDPLRHRPPGRRRRRTAGRRPRSARAAVTAR